MQRFNVSTILFLLFTIGFNNLQAQSIKATNKWKSNDFKTTVNVEDDLFVYVDLGKTLMEVATEQGLPMGAEFYGILKINYGGSEIIAGPMSYNPATFSARNIPFPFNFNLDELQKEVTGRQNEMDEGDLAMLLLMAQSNNARISWIRSLAGNAVAGQEKEIKIDFHLIKDKANTADAGKAIISGKFNCKVTQEGLDKLYSTGRIPAKFRPIADDGMPNDFHKKNANKIVWSTKVSAKDASADAKTSFSSLAGGVYGRVYLPKSLHNYGLTVGDAGNCKYNLKYYSDGKLIKESGIIKIEEGQCPSATTWSFALAPNDGKEGEATESFALFIKQLKEGNHKIKVEMTLDYFNDFGKKQELLLASSAFDLNCSKSDKEAFQKKYAPVYVSNAGGSASSSKKVTIYVYNKSGSKAKYEFMGNGMSGSGDWDTVSKERVTMPAGYSLKVNGREWRKFSKSDEGKTFEYR